MEEGFVLDNADGGARRVSEWVEGAPQTSFWLGLKVSEARKIVTYRCESCGFLESYAK